MANPPADAVEPISDTEVAVLRTLLDDPKWNGIQHGLIDRVTAKRLLARLTAAEARAARAEADNIKWMNQCNELAQKGVAYRRAYTEGFNAGIEAAIGEMHANRAPEEMEEEARALIRPTQEKADG